MLIINTACRFKDLPEPKALFETNCSPIDVAEKLDRIIKAGKSEEITTITDAVVCRVGAAIRMGFIKNNEAEIRIFENKKLKKTVSYDEDGFLIDWEYGFYIPDPISKEN